MVIENAGRCRENISQSGQFLGSEVLISNIIHVYSELILMAAVLIARHPVNQVTIDNMPTLSRILLHFVRDCVGALSSGDAQIEVS